MLVFYVYLYVMGKLDIQPNNITEAKYDFTSLQKNIIYQMIGCLQPLMTRDIIYLDKLSREELKVSIKVSTLAGKNNHDDVIKQAEALMSKIFRYEYDKGSKKHRKSTVLIHDVDHEYYSDTVTLQISPGAVPILLYIGNGFTQYQRTIAVILKSIHSKRMYELCCSWKGRGGFEWPLDRFKTTIGMDGKYKKNIIDFKKNVLDKAKKELKEKADVWFEYDISRKKKGEEQKIKISIKSSSSQAIQDKQKGSQGEEYSFVRRFLLHTFPPTTDKANILTDQITNDGHLNTAYNRFVRLDDEYTIGSKKLDDVKRITKFFLKTDLNIEY